MKLQCAHCPFTSSSLDLNKDNAIAEVILKFAQHIKSHKQIELSIIRDVQKTAAIASTVVMIAKHTTLLNSFTPDDYIQQEFSKLIDSLQDCLGVEVFDNKPAEAQQEEQEENEVEDNPPIDSALQDKEAVLSSGSETLGTDTENHPAD